MILFLVALAILNKLIYKSYLNPVFIQSVVWLLYYLVLSINIGVYDVNLSNIKGFLVLQSIGFSIGGFICCLFTKSAIVTVRQSISRNALDVAYSNTRLFYPFVVLIIIGAIIFLLLSAGSLSIFSIMNLRDSLSEDDGKKVGAIGTLQLLTSVYVVTYIATLTHFKQKWYRPALLISLFVYFTLLLGSKGQFVSFFCAVVFILMWQGKINKTYFSLMIAAFLAILLFLFFLRAGGDSSTLSGDSVGNLLLIYTVTALPALYLSKSTASPIFGYYTFRVFYLWLNKFGFEYPIAPVLSEWVVTPLPTNVYSYIMPYYLDFGYPAVFIFPFILGYIHNAIYFKANNGSFTFLILNALLLYAIITQVWDENYFRQITNWVYILIVIIALTKVNFTLRKVQVLQSIN